MPTAASASATSANTPSSHRASRVLATDCVAISRRLVPWAIERLGSMDRIAWRTADTARSGSEAVWTKSVTEPGG
jgi:hypothetical protein